MITARIWAKDPSLWPGGDAARWLGWLDAPSVDVAELDALTRQMDGVNPRAPRDVLLIGMGGSSLAPEVIARTFPRGCARGDSPSTLRVLDSTHPAAVRDAFTLADPARTVVVVASKSGSTLEPDILLTSAVERTRAAAGDGAAKRFVAITDPGSQLEARAFESGFGAIVRGRTDIGGRFSALSPFGLAPAALLGIDLNAFLHSARQMANRCREPDGTNPGVQLGAFLAESARSGRNKCTLVLPPSLAALGSWIEQLVAESTGKNGVAVLPIDGESFGAPGVYGGDRAFVHIHDASAADPHVHGVAVLAAAGHQVLTIDVPSPAALAGEFFRWEFATAVAGSLLGVNPFDQPDVEASKIATRALTDAHERGEPDLIDRTSRGATLAEALSSIAPGDYFAILAFVPMTPHAEQSLQRTRMRVRDAKRVATSLGFGPRYLHSTGQAFKGGPNTGVFVLLTCDAAPDVTVPGRRLTFGNVVAAQAAGDLQVLRERGRRVAHVHLSGDLDVALAQFDAAVSSSVSTDRGTA